MSRSTADPDARPYSARRAAAESVAAVLSGTSLDEALLAALTELPSEEHGLVRAMTYGVLREKRMLEWQLSKLLDRPLKPDPELNALLLCGIHQLRSMRIPPHAAVAETVATTEALGKAWARGFVNAILRRYQREAATLESAKPPTLAQRLSYPDWLANAVIRDWGDAAETVLADGNEQGPLTLRINQRLTSPDEYALELDHAGIKARPIDGVPDALRLDVAVPVDRLPGFEHGRVSVQDASAQLAAELLDAQPQMRVLDACAAPGGKTAHLLEHTEGIDLLALDVDAARLTRIRENLDRLQLGLGTEFTARWMAASADQPTGTAQHETAAVVASRVRLRAADALQTNSWWDGQPYDRILIDAPCSGTGVIRRHPDIKWLRRATDITAMAAKQRAMLEALWPLLANDGVLLYATCSILRAEGEDIVSSFLAAHPEAVESKIDASWGEPCTHGRRIAPGGDFDGFYYARLVKTAEPGGSRPAVVGSGAGSGGSGPALVGCLKLDQSRFSLG